jgi:threonine dehydrogenase-like Zn-dependent dehydrogenase
MLAVHLDAGRVEMRNVRMSKLKPGFALVRVRVAGVCNTDLELQRGYYGFVGTPGHEFVGEVMEADSKALVGKRVVGEINLACGHCEYCDVDLGRHCWHRTVLGIVKHPGSFAEYLTLPERNLRLVPAGIADEHAVFVEPLAAACEILDQVRIPQSETVAVLGDGKLGLLIAQVLAARGLNTVQFGRHKEKLVISKAMGVEVRIGKHPARAFRYVVDATGSAEGLRQAVAMAKPRGTIVMKSTVHGLVSLDTAPVIVDELTLVGSRCGRFEPAIALLRSKKVNVAAMIHDQFALADAPKAFARAGEKGVLKVLLRNQQV